MGIIYAQYNNNKIKINNINTLFYDYVIYFDRLTIRRNKYISLKLNNDFYNSIVKDTIKLFYSISNCRYTYYFDYKIKDNIITIKTNARNEYNNRYVTIDVCFIGKRWDTYVKNKVYNELVK